MIKISLTILAVYLVYYAGNILYDLFLKKGKELYKEETEEFSMSRISEEHQNSAQNIGIEDVENINTPKSFGKSQTHSEIPERTEERQDMKRLRERFESEQDLDEPHDETKEDSVDTENSSYSENHNQQESVQTQTDKNKETVKSKDWKTLLNLSETLVQLVANHDGHKVYSSIL